MSAFIIWLSGAAMGFGITMIWMTLRYNRINDRFEAALRKIGEVK